jgi:hypothetical protein
MSDESAIALFTDENDAVVPMVLSGVLIQVAAWLVVRVNHRSRRLSANYSDIFARIS